MGETRRRRKKNHDRAWPFSDGFPGKIDLRMLSPVPEISAARIRAMTGDQTIPDTPQLVLTAFRAVVGDRTFHVDFCCGDGQRLVPSVSQSLNA